MRVAALYDIHGNLPALEAVLAEVRRAGVDHVVVGGDVVPGPMVRETLRLLAELGLPMQFLQGNGEVALLSHMGGAEPQWYRTIPAEARETIRWQAEQLPDYRNVFESWPMTLRLEIPGIGGVLFCHATPRDENECFTKLTAEDRLVPIFDGLGVALVVCGHTHMQFDRVVGKTRVVNAGSVGMPFGRTGADWLLLGPDVTLQHTDYDLSAAVDRMRMAPYPQAQELIDKYILHPPSETDMLAAYSKAELQ